MLRRASPDDAATLAWVRATSFGTRTAPEGLEARSTVVLFEHLTAGDFAGFLVEERTRCVAYGVTMIYDRLPTPFNPAGRWGYIQALETHPDFRDRGHGGAILTAMLDWHRRRNSGSVNVQAAVLAKPLYRRHGFVTQPGACWLMRRVEMEHRDAGGPTDSTHDADDGCTARVCLEDTDRQTGHE